MHDYKSQLLLFLLFGLTVCPGIAQVIIEGKILNYDKESRLAIKPTLEGVQPIYWEEIQPNRKGEFKYHFESEGLSISRIMFKKCTYAFLHDSNSTITLVIDQSKISNSVQDQSRKLIVRDSLRSASLVEISGDFERINKYYNEQLRTAFDAITVDGNYYSRLIFNTKTPNEATRITDSLLSAAINDIERIDFNTERKYNKEVKEFLKNDAKAYFASSLINGIWLKRSKQIKDILQDSTTKLSVYNRQWEQYVEYLFNSIPQFIKPNTSTIAFNNLLISLSYFKEEYNKYQFNWNTRSMEQIVIDKLINPDTTFYNTEKTKLAYRIRELHIFLNSQTFYSPTLLNSYNELKKIYPNSQHLAHFEYLAEKLEAYLERSTEDFNEGKIINKNYVQFADLLERFQGKNILLDIWATWCQPCIAEFNHIKPIEEYANNNNFILLYVSIDKPKWEDRWRNNIKYNELKGYHVRINNELIQDMWNVLGGLKGAIPRYAIFNKNGDLIISSAAKPSNKEQLINEMSVVLDSTD